MPFTIFLPKIVRLKIKFYPNFYPHATHLPAADETAEKWMAKTHIRRDSYHSVRSSPSLNSLKNEIAAMKEEIHNRPIGGGGKFENLSYT